MKVTRLVNGDISTSGYRIPHEAQCDGADCKGRQATAAIVFKIITATNKIALGLYLACPECAATADPKSKVISLEYMRRIAVDSEPGIKGESAKTKNRAMQIIEFLNVPRTTKDVAEKFGVTTRTTHNWLSKLRKQNQIEKTQISQYEYIYQCNQPS